MSEEGALITMDILKTLTAPNVVDLPRGHVSPPDLPLQPVHNQAKLGHVFDMVGIVNFDLDLVLPRKVASTTCLSPFV